MMIIRLPLRPKEPYAPLLASLTVPFTAIVPKHAVEADEEAFTMHPIGTGAYKFVEWKQGEYVKLEANDEYFQGAPKTKVPADEGRSGGFPESYLCRNR